MRIFILSTDKCHPIYPYLVRWARIRVESGDSVGIVFDKHELETADFLFMVSCSEIVGPEVLAKFTHSLVIHASDLPSDRGFSPHVWAILRGDKTITLSLLEAAAKVDSGRIWKKLTIDIDDNLVLSEINTLLFEGELTLMDWALSNHRSVTPEHQIGESNYLRRRDPDDSLVSADSRISEIFDLLRVADPVRYPVRFVYRNREFTLQLDAKDTSK